MTSDLPAATTHEWAQPVDLDHLAAIRAGAARLVGGGVTHLVQEVLAYADEEAAAGARTGTVVLTRYPDGSVSVTDDGRGTAVHRRADGTVIRKPVMATKDLRFFDTTEATPLPDGRARRGMSVVAALSTWLVHTNHRDEGAWRQRYEHGIPVGELEEVAGMTGATGTTVHFRPDPDLVPGVLDVLGLDGFDHLRIQVREPDPRG
ncbi:ATP-binding protein [Occultella glacieicola]|uniref:DNA topoisomerase (ATP-hydrolyzing) n=1 Tax=Occultella glacieicola TaxID=2518684 RepID=A0ABY2E140_9MICO|nr:ATP-binding protein [Occultella glacieicola]TDE91514.1 ATP-binding protein [Occultella glacieicola]